MCAERTKGGIMKEIEFCGRSVNEECFYEMLTMQLIPVRGNEEKLEHVPHRSIEDLALVYRLDLGRVGLQDLTALISYDLLKVLGMTEEQLVMKAEQNVPRTHPAELRTLRESIEKLSGNALPGWPTEEPVVYVASTKNGCLGAGVIGYPGFLEESARQLGGSFFILPSSVHELLFLKDDGGMDESALSEMVRSVNQSCVSPNEQFSDHVYYYDARMRCLYSRERGCFFEGRTMEESC